MSDVSLHSWRYPVVITMGSCPAIRACGSYVSHVGDKTKTSPLKTLRSRKISSLLPGPTITFSGCKSRSSNSRWNSQIAFLSSKIPVTDISMRFDRRSARDFEERTPSLETATTRKPDGTQSSLSLRVPWFCRSTSGFQQEHGPRDPSGSWKQTLWPSEQWWYKTGWMFPGPPCGHICLLKASIKNKMGGWCVMEWRLVFKLWIVDSVNMHTARERPVNKFCFYKTGNVSWIVIRKAVGFLWRSINLFLLSRSTYLYSQHIQISYELLFNETLNNSMLFKSMIYVWLALPGAIHLHVNIISFSTLLRTRHRKQ